MNPLAGTVAVPVRGFTLWQVVGGVVWTQGITLAGYALGSPIPSIDRYLLPIIAFVVLLSLLSSWSRSGVPDATDPRPGRAKTPPPTIQCAPGRSAMTELSYLQAAVIGLLQGVTELFPVSSLGHSVLLPALIGGDWQHLVTESAPPPARPARTWRSSSRCTWPPRWRC